MNFQQNLAKQDLSVLKRQPSSFIPLRVKNKNCQCQLGHLEHKDDHTVVGYDVLYSCWGCVYDGPLYTRLLFSTALK